MKKAPVIAIILLLAGAAAAWFFILRKTDATERQKGEPHLVQSHYSDALVHSFENMLDAYYKMNEGFVNWESDTVARYSFELKVALDSLQVEELKSDSALYTKASGEIAHIKAELEGLIRDSTLDEKRGSLNLMSKLMFELLNTVRYDAAKVYYQECPMAFNDEVSGYWLSPTRAVRNPYLGTKHPKYKSTMLKCGYPIDTIQYVQKQR